MSVTYQPRKKQRRRKCGFRARMRKSPHIIKARRLKRRKKLTQV